MRLRSLPSVLVSPKMRLSLGAAFCAAFALSSQAAPFQPTVSDYSATNVVFLGNPQNPVTDPNTGITATVTLTSPNGPPTGTITFLLDQTPCNGTGTTFQSAPVNLVNGSATCPVPATQIGSGEFRWSYYYTSADLTRYLEFNSLCSRISTIRAASPALSLQTSNPTPTLGQATNVKATLVGGFQPSGQVTFYASGPNASSCSQQTALATVPIARDGTVTIPFGPTQPGNYILTASFAGDSLNNGASNNCGDTSITLYPSLTVTAPPSVNAGQSFDFMVTAYDAYPNVATNYNGTVHFTSSNGATLPANSTLVNGRGTFQATLNANGLQTITATDTNNPSRTATASLYAYPQSTFVVTSSADLDDGTCDSNCTVREAINAANNQAGPATITFNIPNMAGCTATNQCTIGLGATLPAVNDDVAINGSANNAQITIEGNFRRILSVNSGKRATITGLTLQGGGVGGLGTPSGGAMHNDGTLHLSGMTFRNNSASNVSGGALGNGSTGTMDVTGCTFFNNVVTQNAGHGGAIYNQGHLTIRQTLFDLNTSQDGFGGAIRHDGVSLTITDSTLTNNNTPHAHGGAISSTGSATITNSVFMSNSAAGMGGAIHSTAPMTLANSTFYSNSAQGDGLGRGGAAFGFIVSSSGITQRITNCTFMNNVSGPNTFGTITNQGNAGDVVLRNVLMANNTRGNCGGSASNADSSNMADDATCGGATQKTTAEINPGFPADNGGPTKTIALFPGSAAINAGNAAVGAAPFGKPAYGVEGRDQRGYYRFAAGANCDVGAYEDDGVKDPSLLVTTAVDELSNPGTGNSLREALAYAQAIGGTQTITFAPSLAGQTITLTDGWNGAIEDTALRISGGDITIDGGDGNPINLVIPQGTRRRHLIAGGGSLQLKNLTFQGGNPPQSNSVGGAAYFYGNAHLTNVRFLNNTANDGAGLFITNTASVQITNGLFQNNTGAGAGGAILNAGGTLTVNDSTFTGNGSSHGGAINSEGSLTVRRTSFTSNTSSFNGGALRLLGTADIAESTVSNNSAANGGGGLISHGNTTLTNVTIANNTAQDGGGAQFFEGTASLRYVTVARNTATGAGGGTAVNFANVTAINTIVSGNSAPTEPNVWGTAFNAASSNNVLNLSAAAAFLGTLDHNGGPTQSVPLLPGSPAFDAGVAIAGLTTDQRGTARPQGGAVDIGAFELVPSQAAAIPIVGPLGGIYQDGVQVSIASTSAGTAVRYTLDGSTPSTTDGTLYTAPFNVTQTSTVKAIAYNGGWLPSPLASVGFTVLTPLPYWRNLQGLPADGSQDMATPAGDGVANLLKYAFNLAPNAGDLSKPNVTILPENGTAGLPYFEIDAQGRLTIEFVRRKASSNPGVAYIVETGSDLNNLMSLSLAGASIVSIDSKWERVTITDPTVSTKRFGRVRIQSLGTYFNDFNAALGAATLRGTASYTNQAVQLTDSVGGQSGAVIFNGITLAPEVTGFTAKFNLQLGPTTTGIPADGASFAVGDLGTGAWGETGPGGAHHLAVEFDTFGGDIGIHLRVNGARVASNATNPYTNGQLVPVEISYDAATGLTVKFNGAIIFQNVAVGGFTFQATDKFGLGARTGGANERCIVDDVQIAPR